MPIYEYSCETCQKVHEVTQKISEAPLEKCPECGNAVQKLISRSSFALKGSGWYTTDYKRKGQSQASGSSSSANSSTSAKPTDSK